MVTMETTSPNQSSGESRGFEPFSPSCCFLCKQQSQSHCELYNLKTVKWEVSWLYFRTTPCSGKCFHWEQKLVWSDVQTWSLITLVPIGSVQCDNIHVVIINTKINIPYCFEWDKLMLLFSNMFICWRTLRLVSGQTQRSGLGLHLGLWSGFVCMHFCSVGTWSETSLDLVHTWLVLELDWTLDLVEQWL